MQSSEENSVHQPIYAIDSNVSQTDSTAQDTYLLSNSNSFSAAISSNVDDRSRRLTRIEQRASARLVHEEVAIVVPQDLDTETQVLAPHERTNYNSVILQRDSTTSH